MSSEFTRMGKWISVDSCYSWSEKKKKMPAREWARMAANEEGNISPFNQRGYGFSVWGGKIGVGWCYSRAVFFGV